MHLVITNIPNSLHTTDLRNYFSEFVEREAFCCFHFRHRPQTQLLGILKLSSGRDADDDEDDNLQTNRKHHVTDDVGGSSMDHEEKSDESVENSIDNETDYQESGIQSDPDSYRIGHEGSSASTSHWLSSGLTGLSSLINEKKQKAKTDSDLTWKTFCTGENTDNATEKSKSNKNQGNSEIKGTLSTRDEIRLLMSNPEYDKRTCCVVEIKTDQGEMFIKKYHKKHWLNRKGEVLISKCFILKVDFDSSRSNAEAQDYRTREDYEAQSLSVHSPLNLIEFRPPPVMPQGNVGTPTQHFKELIRLCQLPGIIIKKLGLEFPKRRGRKRFSQMPFDYGTGIMKTDTSVDDDGAIAFTASGHLIPSSADFNKPKMKPPKSRSDKPRWKLVQLDELDREDGPDVEEWERHETFHEDVTSQDRIKERRFEEELEVTWEKGGSGLVFYTDAQFWREQQGDFDEQTADEWDVDMSIYYQEGAGDKDAQDSVAMLQSNKLRAGHLAQSAFNASGKKKMKRKRIGPGSPPAVGTFEAHTLGFGRRLMEAQGWKDGLGLGRSTAGMPYALDDKDGQHPHDKKGFGFHGEKLQGWGVTRTENTQQRQKKKQRQQHNLPRLISTVFDHHPDPPTPPLRTPEPTTISHRPEFIKFTRPAEQGQQHNYPHLISTDSDMPPPTSRAPKATTISHRPNFIKFTKPAERGQQIQQGQQHNQSHLMSTDTAMMPPPTSRAPKATTISHRPNFIKFTRPAEGPKCLNLQEECGVGSERVTEVQGSSCELARRQDMSCEDVVLIGRQQAS